MVLFSSFQPPLRCSALMHYALERRDEPTRQILNIRFETFVDLPAQTKEKHVLMLSQKCKLLSGTDSI